MVYIYIGICGIGMFIAMANADMKMHMQFCTESSSLLLCKSWL